MTAKPTALIITGGKWHDHAGFTARCSGWLADAGVAAGACSLETAQIDRSCSLVVVCTCHSTPDPELALRLDAISAWTRAGGHLLAVHGATVAAAWHQPWRDTLGASFIGHPESTTVSWRSTACVSNPLSGTAAWHDEPYRHKGPDADAEILLTGDAGDGPHAAAWRRQHGAGQVIYFAGGHDARAWDSTEYRAMILAMIAAMAPQSA
jgi:type 1 glutamine amidotransferase